MDWTTCDHAPCGIAYSASKSACPRCGTARPDVETERDALRARAEAAEARLAHAERELLVIQNRVRAGRGGVMDTTPTCGDAGCEFGHTGMGTNGGCRCIAHRMSPDDVCTLRQRVRLLRARAEAAEAERDALAAELAAMRGERAPEGWMGVGDE